MKANVNYGFDQKEGSRGALISFSGGDITYTINDKVDLQHNNYTKAMTETNRTNTICRSVPFQSYGFFCLWRHELMKADTYRDQHFYGYQVGLKGQIPIGERWQGFASVGR